MRTTLNDVEIAKYFTEIGGMWSGNIKILFILTSQKQATFLLLLHYLFVGLNMLNMMKSLFSMPQIS